MKVYLLLLVLEQLSANFTYCSIFFSFLCRGELQAVLVVILGKKKGRTCSISHHQLSLQCYLKTCLCVVKIKADTTEGKYTPWKCNAELPDGFEYVVLWVHKRIVSRGKVCVWMGLCSFQFPPDLSCGFSVAEIWSVYDEAEVWAKDLCMSSPGGRESVKGITSICTCELWKVSRE